VSRGPLPPPDNLGLHMIEGDSNTSRLSLYHIYNVRFVQHGRGLFQWWAWGEETQALCKADAGASAPSAPFIP
jgi:hypothetical protein